MFNIWGYAQLTDFEKKISISFENTTLKDALKQLEKETSISFAYDSSPVFNKKIKAEFTNESVKEILNSLLSNNNLDYKLIGDKVSIYTKRKDNKKRNKSTISGYIYDAETGEVLIGATIYVKSLGIGAITNIYGFYSLTLPSVECEVLYSFIGYETVKKGITLDGNIELNINLIEGKTLQEVVVTGERKQQESTEISTCNLSMIKVKALPVLLGERDIIKTAQLLPGIQSGNEGASGLYVRGGGPDQNLILLDGVTIYNANHLFGFFSVFNADAINRVKLVKGGFPAEYGGRLSSVVDIQMNEGDMKKIHGEGSIGIISSKLMLNGPIIKDKTSFMISARRTYIDLLARPIIPLLNKQNNDSDPDSMNDKVNGGYYFYDVNSKINHIINKNNRIYFSAYLGDDKFYMKQSYQYTDYLDNKKYYEKSAGKLTWGNKIMALRWNHQYAPKLFSNVTLNFSDYKFVTGFGEKIWEDGKENSPVEDISFEYLSGITDWSGKINFFFYPNPKHKINFGISETYHTFKPGVNQFKFSTNGVSLDTTFGSRNTYAHELHSYFQDDFKVTSKLSANIGIHFANLYVREKWYHSLQPRIALNYQLDEKSYIKASYSRMAQFLHLLSNTSVGLPTDLWVPATDSIPPQYGNQVAIGYVRGLPKGFRISTEGYYKTMENIIEYKEGASFLGTNTNWEQLVEIGKGWSYGAEVLFEKRTGKTTGWIGYTLSWTNRKFENLNHGNTYPYRYDRRHDISVAVTHKFNDKVDIGVVWVYGTGNAVSLALQRYNAIDLDYNNISYYDDYYEEPASNTINYYKDKNDYRMPSYHRLDVGVNIHKEKKWGEATWSFGLYNAYNRKNPFYLQFGHIRNSDKYVLKQISLFPIIPSVSYNFKF